MSNSLIHPALWLLLRQQMLARLRRVLGAFSSPRRLLLSLLAVGLAAVWLGNAAVSMVLRDPYSRDTFCRIVPLALAAYGLWHVLKVACCRPEEPIDWSPAERELLCGGPFTRRDLIAYRTATIFFVGLFKAGIVTFVLLPDLPMWLVGFTGVLLALVFLDLLRVALEIAAWGLSDRVYLAGRAGVLLLAGGAVLAAGFNVAAAPAPADGPLAAYRLPLQFLTELAALRDTPPGRVLEAPFAVFAGVITAWSFTPQCLGLLLAAAGLAAGMSWLAVRLDQRFAKASARSERLRYHPESVSRVIAGQALLERVRLPHVPWWRGAGPLAWRQLLGARRYSGSLAAAMAVPAVLSCLPLLQPGEATATFLGVTAAVVFYTFLLLPASLKFDFRRDLDRLPLLKSLPLSPVAVVAGQLAVPVVLAGAFQMAVLSCTAAARPVPAVWLAGALALLLPLNIFVFAAENLLFLMYPYRIKQEGLDVFLRTTLIFTAKSLVFAGALALTFVWALTARMLASAPAGSVFDGAHRLVFIGGLWGFASLGAFTVTWLLARIYASHDPYVDAPA